MSDFLGFFVRSFLFFFALILAAHLTITMKWFPSPPPDWAKLFSDARITSDNLEKAATSAENTAKSAKDAADNLAKATTALVGPVKQALELAKAVADQLSNPLGARPGGPGGAAPPVNVPSPESVVDGIKKAKQEGEKAVKEAVDNAPKPPPPPQPQNVVRDVGKALGDVKRHW